MKFMNNVCCEIKIEANIVRFSSTISVPVVNFSQDTIFFFLSQCFYQTKGDVRECY